MPNTERALRALLRDRQEALRRHEDLVERALEAIVDGRAADMITEDFLDEVDGALQEVEDAGHAIRDLLDTVRS